MSTREELKAKIRRLKKLPDDFRDIEPGTWDWTWFGEVMGREKQREMEEWTRGPVVALRPLHRKEQIYFKDQQHVTVANITGGMSWTTFSVIIAKAEKSGASFIYTPPLDKATTRSLNKLASLFGMNLRFRGQLVDDNGHPY